MYACADTKTKINQVVPALLPLGDEMWEKGMRRGRHRSHRQPWELDGTPPRSPVESFPHTTRMMEETVCQASATQTNEVLPALREFIV